MIVSRWLAVLCGVAGVILLFAGGAVVLVGGGGAGQATYPLIAGAALVLAYVLLAPGQLRELVTSGRGRRGVTSVLGAGSVIGLLVLGNVVAARSTASFDFSRLAVNTLHPQSREILHKLTADVNATLWDAPSDPAYADNVAILQRYEAASSRFHFTTADPKVDRVRAASDGVVAEDTLVLHYRGRSQLLNPGARTEADISAGILKLESTRAPVVCWVVGEGERDLRSGDEIRGYSIAGDQLARDNLSVRELLLSTSPGVPADCDVVALVGPQKGLSPESTAALAAYLDRGGRLLVALDAWLDRGTVGRYDDLLKPYGRAFSGGLVVPDRSHAVRDEPTATAVFGYGASPITRGLRNRATVFPESTSIAGSSVPGVTAVALASSGPDSYLVQVARQDYDKRQGDDKPGPFDLAVQAERAGNGGRLVMIGTSAVAENLVLKGTGGDNAGLLAASLDWLSGQDSLVLIPPSGVDPPLSLTQDQWAVNLVVVLAVLPLVILLGGVLVWARRRG